MPHDQNDDVERRQRGHPHMGIIGVSPTTPIWSSLRTDPDGPSSVDVFAVLRRKASHQMPPRTGSTQGRWWQEWWRLSEPTIWSSAFKLGCSVCGCLSFPLIPGAGDRTVCWHVLPGSPVGRCHRLPAGLSFGSISRCFSPSSAMRTWSAASAPSWMWEVEQDWGGKTSQFMVRCCARSIIPVKRGWGKFAFRLPW